MPVHRRRFRIEEAFVGELPMSMSPEVDNGEVGPMHHEIMSELRAIRSQMAAPAGNAAHAGNAAPAGDAACRFGLPGYWIDRRGHAAMFRRILAGPCFRLEGR